MRGRLIVTVLRIASSYAQNIENVIDDASTPDTIQYWISPTKSWRIRTFALDHDIHIHSLSNSKNIEDIALKNDQKNYGDTIKMRHVIAFQDTSVVQDVVAVFKAAGLAPNLEISGPDFAFWNPDGGHYASRSKPG